METSYNYLYNLNRSSIHPGVTLKILEKGAIHSIFFNNPQQFSYTWNA